MHLLLAVSLPNYSSVPAKRLNDVNDACRSVFSEPYVNSFARSTKLTRRGWLILLLR